MNYTEEQITKHIIKWLKHKDWKIMSYDFPQSGCGVVFHPNRDIRENTKNKGSYIPDIVCIKSNKALFFENKNRFYYDDFLKLEIIKKNNAYSEDISNFLPEVPIENIFYGVGLPNTNNTIEKSLEVHEKVDFILASDLIKIDIIKGDNLLE
ncbi:hypothetical protein HNP87_001401 [Methanococcus maripaludis]|uniref:Uncharacterized protein n=1 Tax=Methanococcus maripaludis TaxID=39152 RepID=A0A7J9NKQ8_METMI|nr:hypothetical protein [Methanococcus maripaludis]MBA2840869.1 hypothetical protein [Methanococcus maripaludis]